MKIPLADWFPKADENYVDNLEKISHKIVELNSRDENGHIKSYSKSYSYADGIDAVISGMHITPVTISPADLNNLPTIIDASDPLYNSLYENELSELLDLNLHEDEIAVLNDLIHVIKSGRVIGIKSPSVRFASECNINCIDSALKCIEVSLKGRVKPTFMPSDIKREQDLYDFYESKSPIVYPSVRLINKLTNVTDPDLAITMIIDRLNEKYHLWEDNNG